VRFWRPVQATTIAICALPGIVFTCVIFADAALRHPFEPPWVQQVWELVLMLDYFTMFGLSPVLVVVLWLVRSTAHNAFSPRATAILTSMAVWGTLGTAFFWIRLYS
jgi:hypothetical protein